MRRYTLRDDQSMKIKDFLPGRKGHIGGTDSGQSLVRRCRHLSLPDRGNFKHHGLSRSLKSNACYSGTRDHRSAGCAPRPC